ncbi:MAG: PD-(D/E)XK nuclease family protein, partial [Clostridia bacterium]|nr:PD-(D/E)XK nuclease family protein [Clostridia bacterium]
MLTFYTGRGTLMQGALLDALQRSACQKRLIIVPKQLTLLTERMLLRELSLGGTFDLQVISPQRLCGHIFDAAGLPMGTRLDDRGRVMLVRTAARDARSELTIYKKAAERTGFPIRAAEQLETIRQAGLTPDDLRVSAESRSDTLGMKLKDLANLQERYEAMIKDRYLDGTQECIEAIARVSSAAFLKETAVYFYGFDRIPPMLHSFIGAIAAVSPDAALFLPMADPSERDGDVFLPLFDTYNLICRKCEEYGGDHKRIRVIEGSSSDKNVLSIMPPAQAPASRHLASELYAHGTSEKITSNGSIALITLQNPVEECRYAMARARELVRLNKWHWRDVLILISGDADTYAQPLNAAAAMYDVPLFLSTSRSAARHTTAECLLTAIHAVSTGYPEDDMRALLSCGIMPLSADESDRLSNYAVKHGLKSKRWLQPLTAATEGEAKEISELEPLRERLMTPLIHLQEALGAARSIEAQLTALFGFLTEIDAYEQIKSRINRLTEANLQELASEESQVWNRILETFDQMVALCGSVRLSRKDLYDTLLESLSAIVIKALPQADDAVYAQSTDSSCSESAKAIIIIGESERVSAGDNGLLTESQRKWLANSTRTYLGPEAIDIARTRRFYLKNALSMATDFVSISTAMSDIDGAVQRPGLLFDAAINLFNDLELQSGSTDPVIGRMLRSSPRAAAHALADAVALLPDVQLPTGIRQTEAILKAIPDSEADLRVIGNAQQHKNEKVRLDPDIARSLYQSLKEIDVSRLETFAACPFSFFVKYGLKPGVIRPYEYTAIEEGNLFHDAVCKFMTASKRDIRTLSEEEARERMAAIADQLLEEQQRTTPLGESNTTRADSKRLRELMLNSAVALAAHMKGSAFSDMELEARFGRGANELCLSDGTLLRGTIDRTDIMDGYVRIIDYKRSKHDFDLNKIRLGYDLQLPLYLSVEMARKGLDSAGVYYFTLTSVLPDTDSRDKAAIDDEYTDQFRLNGITPEDEALVVQAAPNYEDVIAHYKRKADGNLDSRSVYATKEGFEAMSRCALTRAEEHVQSIRSGTCEIRPAGNKSDELPCRFCEFSGACMYDSHLNRCQIKKKKKFNETMP